MTDRMTGPEPNQCAETGTPIAGGEAAKARASGLQPGLSTGSPNADSAARDLIVARARIAPPNRLFEVDGIWEVTNRSDDVVAQLADRHYPRRVRGCGRVGGPGNVLVLRSVDWSAGWVSYYTQLPDDGLYAWRCSMFRNEGPMLSSSLILDAMRITAERWGTPPRDGWVTYVDTKKVRSSNPGYCFKAAGWRRDVTYRPGRRRASLIRLRFQFDGYQATPPSDAGTVPRSAPGRL